MTPQIARIERNPTQRKSSDDAWPLRAACGRTFAELKEQEEAQ